MGRWYAHAAAHPAPPADLESAGSGSAPAPALGGRHGAAAAFVGAPGRLR
jgi:hypothetical protein